MGCGASRSAAAIAERYRIQERDMKEGLDPRLREIRLADEKVMVLWTKLDTDSNGTLDIREIAMILVDIGHALASNQIEAVFKEIDQDGDGSIRVDEFTDWYKKSIHEDWKNLPPEVPRGQQNVSLHMKVLGQVPAFAGAFNDNAPRHHDFCNDLAAYFSTRVIPPKEMFIRKGEDGDEMYLIVSGTVEILLSDEPGTQPVAHVGPGDIVGEGSLFSAEKRTAFCRAETQVDMLVLSRAALDAVLPRYPRVRGEMEAFLAGRLDGLKQATVEERRMAAQRRAQTANKAYGTVVFKEMFEQLEDGSLSPSEMDERLAAESFGVGAEESGVDNSMTDASSTAGESSPGGVRSPAGRRLHETLQGRLQQTPSMARLQPPRPDSPLKQMLMQPKLTPRSESMRRDFENGVAELSSQLLDLSTSVSDIVPALSAENSRSSLGGNMSVGSNGNGMPPRNPNVEMMDALEEILVKSKHTVVERMEAKLRRVEKSCFNLSDAFKSTHNQELALQSALTGVEAWLDERGLGKSSEKTSCTDEIVKQLQEGGYHPSEWLELLGMLTQDQLMVLAEEAAWQTAKRKKKEARDAQREERERLMRSGMLKPCVKLIVHGIGHPEHKGEYKRRDRLCAMFAETCDCRVAERDILVRTRAAAAAGGGAGGGVASDAAEDSSYAVVTFNSAEDIDRVVKVYKSGAVVFPPKLRLERSDRMTDRMRHMTAPQKRWHKIKVMWRVGLMIQLFISGVESAAETRRQYEKELEESRMAQLELQREQEEAREAMESAEKEQAEAREAVEVADREAAEMEAAKLDLDKTLSELEKAEQAGMSMAVITQLKRIANKKRKVFTKEKEEADGARRRAEQERQEAEEALMRSHQEAQEVAEALVQFEKEQREAELIMRIAARKKGGGGRSKGGGDGEGAADGSAAVTDGGGGGANFELPPEQAVQQFERNLRNYRRNAENHSGSGSGSGGGGGTEKPPDGVGGEGGSSPTAASVSVLTKLATESEVTANILDGLSAALMQLDPPKVVMSTLRAAEAQLIRNRLEHSDDR